MQRVRWGVLSTAKIGVEKVIPAMQAGKLSVVEAIASRSQEAADHAAQKLGLLKSYGSYEELLADPEVDAIYNPLPNHLHVPWSIRALEAGKHVLCEKPLGLSSDEAQELVEAADRHPHLKVMEAFMYRLHPQWLTAKRLIDEGGIGELRTIQSFFSYYNDDPKNIRNMAAMGGGGLMDIGCYSISLSRFIFDSEPSRVSGLIEEDPKFRVDRIASAMLDFGRGTSTFTCSTRLSPYQRVNIFGTLGRIEIEIPFNAPPDRPCRVWHDKGGTITEIELEICDQYTLQGDAFSRAILENTPVPTPLTDAVANMRVIEAIRESARNESWCKLD